MALLGIYVGVIPVALGMLWLPWVRRIPPGWLRVVMALTVGLLAFLAIDATLEGFELAGEGAQAFGGVALVLLGAVVVVPAADGHRRVDRRPARRARRPRARRARSSRCSSRSASGCTTSARGSRSASSYATGALALGAFLVVGFAIHNTTEGLAIVAPIARERAVARAPGRCSACWPGAPAVLGAWIGASAFNSSVAAFLFGAGAGAIAQVIVQLAPHAARRPRPHAAPRRRRRAAWRAWR